MQREGEQKEKTTRSPSPSSRLVSYAAWTLLHTTPIARPLLANKPTRSMDVPRVSQWVKLFNDGHAKLDAGQYLEALPLFKRALKLWPKKV